MKAYSCFVYIVTNSSKTVLYIGFTNDLPQRITEHYLNRGKSATFAGRYHCYNLIYFESFKSFRVGIRREKELKGWLRNKKEQLVAAENPDWNFLNSEIMPWPPDAESISRKK